MYGLGYDSVSDDFKVVRILWPFSNDVPCPVHVFSSKLSLWKSIGNFSYDIPDDLPGTVLNGSPHWVVCGDIDITRYSIKLIVCFDATEEKFKEVPKPNCVGENGWIDLAVLGGCLCVIHNCQESHADVWVMKEYGVKESWTKLFVVPNLPGDFNFHYFTLLCYTKDEDVLMVLNSKKLVVYNPKLNRFTSIGISLVCDAIFYTESLVSPHGCTGTRRGH
jgi:F-box interacting protein